NDMLREADIEYILKDSESTVLIVDESFFQIISNIQNKLPHLKEIIGVSFDSQVPENFTDWFTFKNSGSTEQPKSTISPTELSQIVYTGGTTGYPKGVQHSHSSSMNALYSAIIDLEITEKDKLILNSPLPHAAGISLQAALLRGADVYIERKFNLEKLLSMIQEHRITYFLAVPTMLYRIIDFLKEHKYDISSLNTIVYGTAPIANKRLKEALDVFGPIFIQTFGLTESPGIATKLSKRDHLINGDMQSLYSWGHDTINTKVYILDENNQPLPENKKGEIAIASPTTMVGYYKLPEETNKTIKNGLLYSGDIGYKDENGYVYILDRKKDMIISGGMNIYSSEVEDVIIKHPSIKQVAVIGVPDTEWGEAVTAFVIASEDIERQNFINWCSDQLSRYKHPKSFHFLNNLPLTALGKVDKKKLRDPYWKQNERNI